MTATKPARLSAERIAEIRAAADRYEALQYYYTKQLLAEIDALRAERDEARAALSDADRLAGLGADALESCQRSRAALRAELADAEARGEQRGRAAERAAIDAWMRDRDAQRERNAEDIFEAAYDKAPKGSGHSEAVHRGVVELAVAIGSGLHTGEAAERHRRDDFEDGVSCGREMERADVVAWLRVTPRAGGRLVSINSSQDIARMAEDIQRGDHVPPGTPPADDPEHR